MKKYSSQSILSQFNLSKRTLFIILIIINLISLSHQWISKISDNIEKQFSQYMGAKSIQDFVIHFDQQVTIDLDQYFLGQNLNYDLKVSPQYGISKNYINKLSFMAKLDQQQIPNGQQAVTSFIGYCPQFDKHVIYFYTSSNKLYAYFAYIRDQSETQNILNDPSRSIFQPINNQLGLDVQCPTFPQAILTCDKFHGDYNSILTLGCLSQYKDPILVRFNVNLELRQVLINSCIKFTRYLQQDDIYIKFISPQNNFVILQVQQYRNNQANVHQYYVNIPQVGDQTYSYHQNKLNQLRQKLLSPSFFGSQIAQPLNLHGFAYINNFIYIFNQLGELYFVQLNQVSIENGQYLTLINEKNSYQPINVHGYYVQKVVQARVWDKSPNRLIIQGRSKFSGTKSYIEITIDPLYPTLPILSNVFQNLNPYDSFYMNDRGKAMENNSYLISQQFQGDKKFILRVFSKDLSFYKMPIADYFVSNLGYIDIRFLDFYANNLLVLEPSKFQMRLLNGNKVTIGNQQLKKKYEQVWYATEQEKNTQQYFKALSQLNELRYVNFNSTVSSTPGFLQQKILGFNSTFRTKFIYPMSEKVYQAKGSLIDFYDIGEHSVVKIQNTAFIGPNITLTYKVGDNSNIPQHVLDDSFFIAQKLLKQGNHSYYNPQEVQEAFKCHNSTFFYSNFYKAEIFVQMCYNATKVYCLLNKRSAGVDGVFQNYRWQIIDVSPYNVLQVKHDVASKAIIILTQLLDKNYIQVFQLLPQYEVIWRAKSEPLSVKARKPYVTAPSMFLKTSIDLFMYLIVVGQNQELLMLYTIDLNIQQSISHVLDQENPYKTQYGQLIQLFYLPNQFILIAYEKELVISRANSLDSTNHLFDFKKPFKQNKYIKIQNKDDVLLLFKDNLIEQYNFQDPFIPKKTRNLIIPYNDHIFYRDPVQSVLSTVDIQNRVISIVQRGPIEDADLNIICFSTNRLTSHQSLLFLQKLYFPELHPPDEIIRSHKYIFGYKVSNGANILNLYINYQFLISLVNDDHIFHISTPPYTDLRHFPLNITIYPQGSTCQHLSEIDEPCGLSTQLVGVMSGAVIKKNDNFVKPNQIASIVIDKPQQNDNFIMGTYFEGYNVIYNITTIKEDPNSLKQPLLKLPKMYQNITILGQQKAVNYTHQIIVQKEDIDDTIIITIDQLRNLQMRVINYNQQKNQIMFDVIHTRSINSIQKIYQISQIRKQPDKKMGARSYWVIYGYYQGVNQIIIQNVTSFYDQYKSGISDDTQILSDFQILSHFQLWYDPTKWIYDKHNEKFIIGVKDAKPFDDPLITYNIDWQKGRLTQQTTIDAIYLNLNQFHAKSFFIHDRYPMLIAGGKSSDLIFVDLTTSTFLSSVNIQILDRVLQAIQPFQIQWMDQKTDNEFYAFVKDYGMITLNMTLQTAYDDIDRISDISVTIIENVHQKGQVLSEYSKNIPFSQKDGMIVGLFFDSVARDQFRYLNTIKLYNSFEAKRSRVLYAFKTGNYSDCSHPRLFYPSRFNKQENQSLIFLSILCNGSLKIYKLQKYQFLQIDYQLTQTIDSTLYPVEQILTISAQNDYSQGSLVTMDFRIVIQNSGYKNSVMNTSVLAIIIFLLFVIFLILAWLLKTKCRSKKGGGIELPKNDKDRKMEEEELIHGDIFKEILLRHKTSIERNEKSFKERINQSGSRGINLEGSFLELEAVQKGSWGSEKFTSPNTNNQYFKSSQSEEKYRLEEVEQGTSSISSSPKFDRQQKKKRY